MAGERHDDPLVQALHDLPAKLVRAQREAEIASTADPLERSAKALGLDPDKHREEARRRALVEQAEESTRAAKLSARASALAAVAALATAVITAINA